MFETISIDCLNIIFSFCSTAEMGRVMNVSKKCRKIVRECNYAWYDMYKRSYKTYNKNVENVDNHNCDYSIECLRNPNIPDNKRKFSKDAYLPGIIALYKSDRNKYQSLYTEGYAYNLRKLNDYKNKVYERELNELKKVPIIKEVCENLKYCINPNHIKMPQYEKKKNYRRLLRILFLTYNKKVKFTKRDKDKLNDLSLKLKELKSKQRIAELVKLNDLYLKIEELKRKQRIAELVSQYE